MASGTLKLSSDGDGEGTFTIVGAKFGLTFEKADGKPDDNRPSHHVYVSINGSAPCAAGAAWAKKGTRGALNGIVFYSVTLEDPHPLLRDGLNFMAFPSKDQTGKMIAGQFDLTWSRPRQAAAA